MLNLTQNEFIELLDYNSVSGELTWKFRKRKWFSDNRSFNTWNTRFCGKAALSNLNTHGYKTGFILGKFYQQHRVIWFMYFGYWPNEIDHEDGNRCNNKIMNLKNVSREQNGKNRSFPVNNISGELGINFYKRTGKWRAVIKSGRKNIHLGYFTNFHEALAARKAAEIKYNFNPNHGRLK